ncbi:hypothetical protein Bca4012_032796 [Brassica carinata]
MAEDGNLHIGNSNYNGEEEADPENNTMNQPLLKRHRTLSSTPLALVGTKVSHIESLDYEINENDLFKHDWRSRSKAQVFQYIFAKWTLACLVGLLTGLIATLINLAVENIAGYKLLAVGYYIAQDRYLTGLLIFTGANLGLTLVATILVVVFAPTAAGPGIPEIKAYLNGVDTPNMFGATTMIVKIVGSIGAVAAGLDLGKEGPLVHIGSCIASLLGQGGPDNHRIKWRWLRYFNNDRDRRDLITCGSASGVRYHAVDIIPVTLIGVFGGILGSLYNNLLHKVLRLYNLINQKGKIHKVLLSLSVSLFTSVCLYGLPFLAECKPCNPSIDEACPTNGRSGNFKQFNCPNGYYNDLATLFLTTNDDAVRNVFSSNTPNEFGMVSLWIYFGLYCILGLITFGIATPSGLFLPIILMGSAYGRMLGTVMGSYTKIDQGLYAVLGAASLMAGSMRMTVSLCVIFLELTNNLLLLPITMFVLLIAKTVGDSFNLSIYEIILHLKGLPFLEANPEPWMRNLTVGELVDAKPPVITLRGVEKVANIVDALRNTTHNAFPVLDGEDVDTGAGTELHGLILRAHLVKVLKKRWFLNEKRRTEEWEVREKFTPVELAEREDNFDDVAITSSEMQMWVDLHPLTNTTPYTVVQSMSVAKALVLFRSVGLRHLLVVPKIQASGMSPVIGILTRQDLRAYNILQAFPRLDKHKSGKLR